MRLLSRVLVALFMVFGALGVHSAAAQDAATQSFTLQPGGTATVDFEAFCVDFGKDFPEDLTGATGLAPDDVRNVLFYALQNNLATTEPVQVQAAIWQITEGQTLQQSGDITQQIVDNIDGVAIPELGATSVLDAVGSGDVTLTMNSWDPQGDKIDIGTLNDNYYGSGQLTLENTSDEAVTLAMPVGVLFEAGQAEEQNMAGYATNVQVNNPAQTLPETSALNMTPLWLVFVGIGLLIISRVVRRAAHA